MTPSTRLLSVEDAVGVLLPEFQRLAGPMARRLRDPTLTPEDLVSIANLAVLKAFSTGKHARAADPQSYLLEIGKNAMRDAVRASEARRRVKVPPPEETTVESAEDTAMRNLLVGEILQSLPPDLSDIVQRRYLQQQTIPEIAKDLNVSTRTIDRRLLETMKQLRAKFAATGDD